MKIYSFLTTEYLLLFATDDTDGQRLFVAEFLLAVVFVVDALADIADGSIYFGGMGKESFDETLLNHFGIVDFNF